jgi:hypothetical protein
MNRSDTTESKACVPAVDVFLTEGLGSCTKKCHLRRPRGHSVFKALYVGDEKEGANRVNVLGAVAPSVPVNFSQEYSPPTLRFGVSTG